MIPTHSGLDHTFSWEGDLDVDGVLVSVQQARELTVDEWHTAVISGTLRVDVHLKETGEVEVTIKKL